MRAVLADAFGGPEVLELLDIDVPEPGPGQVRIAVEAAAVNPVDLATRQGLIHESGMLDGPPVRFGWDVAGRVDAMGIGVRRLRIGQPVIGLSDRLAAPGKTHADAVVLEEAAVAAVSGDLESPVAATLPLAGLTALQALDLLDLHPGQSILVTGVGGAVGSLTLQLARLRGLRVIAAGRARDATRASSLGADAFLESSPRLAEAVRGVVGGGVDGAVDSARLNNASLDSVRPRGAHVSLAVLQRPAPLRGIRSVSVAVAANWEQLALLGSLAATGALQVEIAETMGLPEARKAHELLATGGIRGRVVLQP
jgi:NADPH:quinone reductase-like Zn-dependent oxidoreductase